MSKNPCPMDMSKVKNSAEANSSFGLVRMQKSSLAKCSTGVILYKKRFARFVIEGQKNK